MGAGIERVLTLDGLSQVLYKSGRSNRYIDNAVKSHNLSDVQKAFFTRLFLGTLEKLILIDCAIDVVSKTPSRKQNPVVLNILRLSVYQIFFMDKVPVHAVYSSALSLCEKNKIEGLKGFVNGVLRSITEKKDKILSDLYKKENIRYSIPKFMYKYIEKAIGKEELSLMMDSENKGGIALRVNEGTISFEEAASLLKSNKYNIDLINELSMIKVNNPGSLADIPGFYKGYFYAQDPNTVRAILEAGINPGDFIIDVCAAPGGKGLLAAYLAGKNGKVLMRDLSFDKVVLIAENITRLGVANARAQKWDATVLDGELLSKADLVIADLPCSGLGTIHKKPEIKYRVTMDSIKELSEIQKNILNTVCKYVKLGGRLLYSTCTFGQIENEDNALDFINTHNDFEVIFEKQYTPGIEGFDGFYACLMERRAL